MSERPTKRKRNKPEPLQEADKVSPEATEQLQKNRTPKNDVPRTLQTRSRPSSRASSRGHSPIQASEDPDETAFGEKFKFPPVRQKKEVDTGPNWLFIGAVVMLGTSLIAMIAMTASWLLEKDEFSYQEPSQFSNRAPTRHQAFTELIPETTQGPELLTAPQNAESGAVVDSGTPSPAGSCEQVPKWQLHHVQPVDVAGCRDGSVAACPVLMCEVGHNGPPPVLSCVRGEWLFTGPGCTPAPCRGAPSGKGYGKQCDELTTGGKCTQRCVEGYTDNNGGRGQVYTCSAGELEGIQLVCKAVACTSSPDWPAHHVQPVETRECDRYQAADCPQLTCEAGYSGTPPVLACGPAGTWTLSVGQCSPSACEGVPAGEGYGTQCMGLLTGGQCTHFCTSGYSDNNGGYGQAYTCPHGRVSGTPLVCTPIACSSDLPDWAAHHVRPLDHEHLAACDTAAKPQCATLHCADGYLGTPPVLNCNGAGSWIFSGGGCTAASCQGVPVGEGYGAQCASLATGGTCRHFCNEGYIDNNGGRGQSYTCPAGKVVGTALQCSAMSCSSMPDWTFYHVQPLEDLTSCARSSAACPALRCREGYTGVPPTLSCSRSGMWSFQGEGCTAAACVGVPSGEGFGTMCNGLVTGATCTHTCEQGYSDNNGGYGQVYTCPKGQVSGTLLTCNRVTCNAEPNWDSQHVNPLTAQDLSNCRQLLGRSCPALSCANGYSGEPPALVCGEEGSWSFSGGSCNEVNGCSLFGGGFGACGNVPNSVCTDTGVDSRTCACAKGHRGSPPLTGIKDSENTFSGHCQGLANAEADCWVNCGGQSGPCAWCGSGLCCRKNFNGGEGGCKASQGGEHRHVCVAFDS